MCCIVYTLPLEWLGLKHKQNTSNWTAVYTSSNVRHSLYNSIVLLLSKCEQEEIVGSAVCSVNSTLHATTEVFVEDNNSATA